MNEEPMHVVRLEVTHNDAQARLIGQASDAEVTEIESYIVILNFDARSRSFFARRTSNNVATAEAIPASGNPPHGASSSLSARESEVLSHLALGQTDKEIARSMAISIGTVKVHVKTVIRKLGVANRTQAAILFLFSFRHSDGG